MPPLMTLAPMIEAGPAIALHAAAASLVTVLGPVVLLRRRRDRLHRIAGYVWVAAMVVAAVTALGIHENPVVGPFSPIHLLIGLVGFSLWTGIRAARAGRMVEHGRIMAQLYLGAICVAGAFTLLPGRRMNAVLFGGDSWAGFVLGAAALGVLGVLVWRAQPRAVTATTGGETPFSSAAPSATCAGSAVVAELVDAQR
jgi:uncharacterized membrane protein